MQKLREHYIRFLSADEEYAKLDWEDAYSHLKRFEVLQEAVSLEGKSLLDVGCGVASLYRYLKAYNISFHYTGIDALPEMIHIAQKLSPEAHLLTGDPFQNEIFSPESFDVVFASGIFNLNIGYSHDFLYHAIEKMHLWAKEYVVFNALHCRSQCQETTYLYYNPEQVVNFLSKKYGDTLRLIDDYLINDFTIVMKKH
ncbi:class I SAM-dependent methyltransferase [Thermospira aquatica]|uniref:Class I SAM-dependent methyltransferase n=1 Tax=Thermospira aquatica TaxID=2828656 RepID=A0AAX3BE88_9SPIR|nr:class I SAM-dependent methyltransferase [Thermospira aquatica]URA10435.1 class I SAM-dependent methyltransferase [Thermospira aquatica]